MLSAACTTLGRAAADCCYELSVANPDKGLLPIDEVRRRLQPFVDQGLPLVITKVRHSPALVANLGHDASSSSSSGS